MKLVNKIIQFYTDLNEYMKLAAKNKVSVYAACASFYILMSFIPFIIIAMALVPYMPFSQNDVIGIILDFVPQQYSPFFVEMVNDIYLHSSAALSISILATVWSAARGILGITQGLNEINGIDENRNNLVLRLRSALYTLALLIGMILMVIISVFGNTIVKLINRYLVIPDFINDILQFQHIFMLIILTVMFLFFFCVLPAKKKKVSCQIIGAFFAALLWWLFSKLFSMYVSDFNSYSMYGSFAILIIMGVWLYTGMYIMFMGAQYNAYRVLRKGNK